MFKLLTFIVLIALLYNLVTGRPLLPRNKNNKVEDKEEDEYDDYQEIE